MTDPIADILAALTQVVPEADPQRLDRRVPLAEQLDIDSMDFLNFIAALCARRGIDIPEADYVALATLDGAAAYLAQRGG